jgi:hypothetical protein
MEFPIQEKTTTTTNPANSMVRIRMGANFVNALKDGRQTLMDGHSVVFEHVRVN